MTDYNLILPRELPDAATAATNGAIPLDDGSAVVKVTPKKIVDAGRPFATQGQAEAGTASDVAMSPLTTKQAIEAVVPAVVTPYVDLAEAWAESQTPPDPGMPTSKSAKTWAYEAQAAEIGAEDAADRAEAASDAANRSPTSWEDFQTAPFIDLLDGAVMQFNGVQFVRDRSASIAGLGAGEGWGPFGDASFDHFDCITDNEATPSVNNPRILACLQYADSAKVSVIVPSGVYWVGPKILFNPVNDCRIIGEPGSVIKGDGASRVAVDRPVLEIDGLTKRKSLTVEGVTFDNSLRQFVNSEQSGTALSLKRLNDIDISKCRFLGGALSENLTTGFGDSGITAQECSRGMIHDCYFYRQPDLGIYLTGGGAATPNDDQGDFIIYGNVFELCQVAVSAKRQSQRTVFEGNICKSCSVGFSLFEANIAPGRSCVVTGNIFEKTGTRAIDIRGGFGDVITGNMIIDWGYRPDGVTLSSFRTAMFIRGCELASITGNTIALKDWVNNGHIGIQFESFDDPDKGTVQSRRNVLFSNSIFGVSSGINELNSTTDNHGDNWISATSPVLYAEGSRSTYGVMSTNGARDYSAFGRVIAQFNREGPTDGQMIRFERNGASVGEVGSDGAGYCRFVGSPEIPLFNIADIPPATNRRRQLIYVAGEVGGDTVAFSDGINWRRVQDREIVS